MRVAFVVGGTGMLTELTQKLGEDYDVVGVVARDKAKLEQLAAKSDNIKPISANYNNHEEFDEAIRKFVVEFGKPELIVSWIHSIEEQVVVNLASYCTSEFYEVTGTSGREADHISHQHEKLINSMGLKYHRVILGSIDGRWLNNHEISTGVISAIQENMPEYIVGE